MVELPLELIEAIIGEPAPSFSVSYIQGENPDSRLAGFCREPSYVHDLRLVDAWFGTDPIREVLTSLFPLLTNLCRLAISSPFVDWNWNTLPVDFRAVFVGLLCVPSLRFLGLAQCTGVPSSIIRHALLTCRQVSLRDVGIFSEDEVFPSDKEITQVYQLSIPVYALLLREEMAPRSLGDVEDLARKSSDSLQHLVVHFREGQDPPTKLPNLPRLRSLTLTASFCQDWVPTSALTTIANLPSCAPNIEDINVVVDFALGHTGHTRATPWPEVDEALKSLPHLRGAHFHIRRKPQGDIESGTRQMLPLASEAGLLAFSTPVPYRDWSHPPPFPE
ncbi:hypothetical protein B0H19DRAFT_1249996 [Mycena capillaripes]|nr:hypothetical protein B0H19DRAFT_1249996 [Mycena capillaripes]